MEYMIKLNNTEESNLFLRAFWSQLRESNGKYGWSFFPYRDSREKIIGFGSLSTSRLSQVYNYKVQYKTRGVIYKLIVESTTDKDILEQDNVIVTKAIEKALDFNKLLSYSWGYSTFKTSGYPVNNIRSNLFNISYYEENKFNLEIKVEGFDDKDKSIELKRKKSILKDFLSTQISQAIYDTDYCSSNSENINKNFYYDELWIDDYPTVDNKILISRNAVQIIDMIISDNINEDLNNVIKASRLYHTACKYEDLTYKGTLMNLDLSTQEISNTLFMSSLEVLSEIIHDRGDVCESCNREIFSIRKKVINLTKNFSGGYMDKKEIDNYYKIRSSYMHSGIFLSDRSYSNFSNPQLSKCDSGFISQIPMINLIKLRETIGYIFRNILHEILKD